MKRKTQDKLFLTGTVILMLGVLILIFLTIKELPETTSYAPLLEMGYPLGPI